MKSLFMLHDTDAEKIRILEKKVQRLQKEIEWLKTRLY